MFHVHSVIGFGYANYYATKNYNACQTHLAWTVVIIIVVAPLEASFYLHKLSIAPLETSFNLHKLSMCTHSRPHFIYTNF